MAASLSSFFILACCCYAAQSEILFSDAQVHDLWTNFKRNYGKNYESCDEDRRKQNFIENLIQNELHNRQNLSYTRGINHLSDLSYDELVETRMGFIDLSSNITDNSSSIPPSQTGDPQSIDWRNYGAVTQVKDQGSCGSCWAFSATGAIEAQNKLSTGTLTEISEQNLVDCTGGKYGNSGCGGGWMNNAFNYIIQNGGVDTESSYPYKGRDGTCGFNSNSIGAYVKGYRSIPVGCESCLQNAVATYGPVSVALNANNGFHQYKGGVFNDPSCQQNYPNHAVLVIGYGTDTYGGDYWIVKNSWGPGWGDRGYIRIARNQGNMCGIANYASVPY